MKIVFRANDILEAHIVAGMLQAANIEAHVGGHYLQGAIGDLAPVGLASVSVADEEAEAAMRMIREYEGAGENDSFTA